MSAFDLQAHSIASDGALSPADVVARAGLGTMLSQPSTLTFGAFLLVFFPWMTGVVGFWSSNPDVAPNEPRPPGECPEGCWYEPQVYVAVPRDERSR